eukprot:TRINITY_DN1031_c0_g3_i1.p1 TRINITY_DN1031_c0_g3~~TRINITY_DN1031_c0_g3_i1.p1  ORF type:complete len:214 (+),score=45.57 TRINITY_DN1031_c0_g3_i1:72-713(+)
MNSEALKLLVKDSKSTKRLDLSHQNLDEVPEEVINAHHLEKLVLSNNQIKEIPNKLIKNNPNLKEIDVSHNLLETLPAAIGELKNLESCDASCNRLKTLPSTFQSMFTYQKPYVYRNGWVYYNTYHQSKINLSGNDDLEIEPQLANDDPQAARNHFVTKATREQEAKEQQEPIAKAKFAEEKEREVERNQEKKKLRKQNEKDWSKNRRQDRHN